MELAIVDLWEGYCLCLGNARERVKRKGKDKEMGKEGKKKEKERRKE